jgi:hypothetical protein
MLATYDFEIGGREFRAQKMSGRTQLDVLKRMLPIFGSVMQIWAKLPAQIAAAMPQPEGEAAAEDNEFGALLASTLERISDLSDANSKFVYDTCLSAVSMKSGANYARIMNGERFMFEELDNGATILGVTAMILKNEFSDFFIKARGDLLGALLSQK